jgi:hypothetical protein
MIPAQTETETILTILGAVLCLGGWLLIWLGTRVAGISLGLAAGVLSGQVLAGLIGWNQEAFGWCLLGSGAVGAVAGLWVVRGTTRLMFGLAGLLLGALVGDALHSLEQEGWKAPSSGGGGSQSAWVQPVSGAGMASGILAGAEGVGSGWNQKRLRSVAAGGFLGAAIGVLAQKLLIIGLTSYLGVALLGISFPPLRQHPEWLVWVLGVSVVVQGGLAWRFLRSLLRKPIP